MAEATRRARRGRPLQPPRPPSDIRHIPHFLPIPGGAGGEQGGAAGTWPRPAAGVPPASSKLGVIVFSGHSLPQPPLFLFFLKKNYFFFKKQKEKNTKKEKKFARSHEASENCFYCLPLGVSWRGSPANCPGAWLLFSLSPTFGSCALLNERTPHCSPTIVFLFVFSFLPFAF